MTPLQLKQSGTILGTLHNVKWDMFWSDARFEPTEAFAQYKALFDEEYKTLKVEQWDKNDQLQQQIADLKLRLVSEDGQCRFDEFLIHIYGDEAWFRY